MNLKREVLQFVNGVFFSNFIYGLIVLNVITMIFESHKDIQRSYYEMFQGF